MYNFLNKEIDIQIDSTVLLENYKKILISLTPILPHFGNECLEQIGEKQNFIWPEINKKYLETETINMVVQINGKKKTLIVINKDLEKKEILEYLHENVEIFKKIREKKIKNAILVPNRLINIIY